MENPTEHVQTKPFLPSGHLLLVAIENGSLTVDL